MTGVAVEQGLDEFGFVKVDNGLGVGQVTRIDQEDVEVTYFDSVNNPVARREIVGRDRLKPIVLDPGRRCYLPRNGHWWPGRVLRHELGRYQVALGGGGGEKWIGPDEFRVRWDKPPPDPLEELIGGWWSHPKMAQRRANFLAEQAERRSAAFGLTGALSLSAEFHAHQVQVARQVLDDPVGRFLLADEVGLGKTLEALIVVRQVLLDDPEAYVRVIAPSNLIGQWTHELFARSQVDTLGGKGDFPLSTVEVLSLDSEIAWSASDDPDLLIIDEAHLLASDGVGNDRGRRTRYEAAVRLTQRAGLVLLLSATPSLHRDQVYLAMLHLLDPDRHDLDDLEGFREQLSKQDALAEALLSLDPDDPPELVLDALAALEPFVINDKRLAAAHAEFTADLDGAAGLSADQRSALDRFGARVAEAFRFDRRILRTRRKAIESRFPVRGRTLGNPVVVPGDAYEEAEKWLENWKTALRIDCRDDFPESADCLWKVFARVAIGAPGLLESLSRIRLAEEPGGAYRRLGLTPGERSILRTVPLGPEETRELKAVPRLESPLGASVAEAIAEVVWEYPFRERTLVVTSQPEVAFQLEKVFGEYFRLPGESLTHLERHTDAEQREAVLAYANGSACHVLICDRSAREGLNLQMTEHLILVDPPFEVDGLEQQIGRVDRFSHSGPVDVRLVTTGTSSGLRADWVRALADGFQVFDSSVAAHQSTVAELAAEASQAALRCDGSWGLDDPTWIRERMASAQRELTKAELLDGSALDNTGEEIAARVTSFDAESPSWEGLVRSVLRDDLRLAEWSHAEGQFSYWLSHPRLPKIRPEIGGNQQAKYFADVVSTASSTRRYRYSTGSWMIDGGPRVMRTGCLLLGAVERYMRDASDDGRVAAVWRQTPRLPEDRESAGLVFRYSLQPGTADDLQGLPRVELAAIRRRVQQVLGHSSVSVVISSEGDVLDDEDDLGYLLAEPFDGTAGDRALFGAARERLADFFPGNWESALRRLGGVALEAAVDLSQLSSPAALREMVKADSERRIGVLEGRGADELIAREQRLAQRVAASVECAALNLDAITLVVVSDQPFEPSKVRGR